MGYAITVEVHAKDVFDEESVEYYETLTEDEREGRIAEMKADVIQMFRANMAGIDAVIDVIIRIEPVGEADE